MMKQTDAVRLYDGNGREIKRKTANYVQTETSSSWILKSIKYYIRSSVLCGATVSEVWANGKKGKTFVRAAEFSLKHSTNFYISFANSSNAAHSRNQQSSSLTVWIGRSVPALPFGLA